MTNQNQIITQNKELLFQDEVNVNRLRAMSALADRKLPVEIIRTRPGRGGKTFDYVPHTYVTETLVDGLDQFFSHDVLDYNLFDDHSAVARVQLQIHTPITQHDGSIFFFSNSITEIGAFQGAGSMLAAHRVAAAASRGLAKCLMRRFKLGLELYKNDDDITPGQAWDCLVRANLPPNALWYASLSTDGMNFTGKAKVTDHRKTFMARGIRRLCEKVGIPYLSPHKLRHGHAVYAVGKAQTVGDLKAVSQNLMHSSLVITDGIYGGLTEDETATRIASLTAAENGNHEAISPSVVEQLKAILAQLDK